MKKLFFGIVLVSLLIAISGCVKPPVCPNAVCEAGEKDPQLPTYCPADCETPVTHTECKSQTCVKVEGQGTNKCSVDADCKPAAVCPETMTIASDKTTYFGSEQVTVAIKVKNNNGTDANTNVLLTAYFDGNKAGSTYVSVKNGYWETKGTPDRLGEFKYIGTIAATDKCPSIDAKTSFTIKAICPATLTANWDKNEYKYTGDNYTLKLKVTFNDSKPHPMQVGMTFYLDGNKLSGTSTAYTDNNGNYVANGKFPQTPYSKPGTYKTVFSTPSNSYCKAIETATTFVLKK